MLLKSIEHFHQLRKYELWKKNWQLQGLSNPSLDLNHYIEDNCSPEDSLIVAKLFFPDFIFIDDCIFLADFYDPLNEHYLEWKEKLVDDKTALEAMINHVHLYDVFLRSKEETSDAIYKQLANIMSFSWRLVLDKAFPDKKIIIDVSDGDENYGPTITLYQVRSID